MFDDSHLVVFLLSSNKIRFSLNKNRIMYRIVKQLHVSILYTDGNDLDTGSKLVAA
jgi:hypothetical protein